MLVLFLRLDSIICPLISFPALATSCPVACENSACFAASSVDIPIVLTIPANSLAVELLETAVLPKLSASIVAPFCSSAPVSPWILTAAKLKFFNSL